VQGDRQGHGRLRGPAASHHHLVGKVADAGDDGRRAVWIEPGDGRGVGPEDTADLLCDGGEHVARRHPVCDQRGDPP
jgi:hypothetical protein